MDRDGAFNNSQSLSTLKRLHIRKRRLYPAAVNVCNRGKEREMFIYCFLSSNCRLLSAVLSTDMMSTSRP